MLTLTAWPSGVLNGEGFALPAVVSLADDNAGAIKVNPGLLTKRLSISDLVSSLAAARQLSGGLVIMADPFPARNTAWTLFIIPDRVQHPWQDPWENRVWFGV
jgi:hypothetical protein